MKVIEGLHYYPAYLSPEEQAHYLGLVDEQIWLTDLKRRVQHYGYKYDYKRRTIDESLLLGALPMWLQPLAMRIHTDGLIGSVPDQVIVNEYQLGQGIARHVDCVPCFDDTILTLTLGAACVMQFFHVKDERKMEVFLGKGGVLVMQGDARYNWKHGIPARKSDVWEGQRYKRQRRVSLTFRRVILS